MKVRRIAKSRPLNREREQFYEDLLQGIRDMKAGIVGRVTYVQSTRPTGRANINRQNTPTDDQADGV